jgi:hypothetical protein
VNIQKVTSRKFAAVSASSLLALVNETLGMGIDRWITIAIIGAGVGYALCEAWIDVARIKASGKTK